jgi:hypothetical protein
MEGGFMASNDPRAGVPAPGRFVLLNEKDNILVCAEAAKAGAAVEIDGQTFVLQVDIALGHKIARKQLAVGDRVLRYGISIGFITQPVTPGEHVHNHNLQSGYIAAHGRGCA